MLREGWNFHGDIAIELEGDAQRVLGLTGRPHTKIFDADGIEGAHFVEVMILLLRMKSEYSIDRSDIDEFVRKCAPFLGVSGVQIPAEEAAILYTEFRNLLKA